MVFLISAAALFSGKVDGDAWVVIATAYIGTEGVIDAVTRLRGVKLPLKEGEKENNSI